MQRGARSRLPTTARDGCRGHTAGNDGCTAANQPEPTDRHTVLKAQAATLSRRVWEQGTGAAAVLGTQNTGARTTYRADVSNRAPQQQLVAEGNDPQTTRK